MKKAILMVVLLFFAAGMVCGQEDMTFQHFYESMQFVVTTVPYGVIGNLTVLENDDMYEAMSMDKDNDGFVIIEAGQTMTSWGFSMIHLRSWQSVIIMLSSTSNYNSSAGRLFPLSNASQRAAFLNEINAVKTRLENSTARPAPTRPATGGPRLGSGFEYFLRGLSHSSNGDYDAAIADFTEAIRLQPNDHSNYSTRGNAYVNKGDYDRAIADYTQAIRLAPNNATYYGNRGNAYNRKGEYPQARADVNRALQIDPNNQIGKDLDAELKRRGY